MRRTMIRSVSLFLLPALLGSFLPAAVCGELPDTKPADIWEKQTTPTPSPIPVKTSTPVPTTTPAVEPSVTLTPAVTPAIQPLSLTRSAETAQPLPVTRTAATEATGITRTAETPAAMSTAIVRPGDKSPLLAFGIALIPGFFVHGAGHYYASRPVEGTTCLLLEGASFYLFYRSWLIVEPYTNSDNEIDANPSMNTGQINAAAAMTVGGLILFLTTWAYDMSGSPLACMEFNKKNQNGLVLDIRPETQKGVMALNWKKLF